MQSSQSERRSVEQMKAKSILLGVAGLAIAVTMTACESSGDSSASGDMARDDVHASAENTRRMDIPAVDTANGEATIGEPAPNFTLRDLDGKKHTLSDYTDDGKIVVLEWFNPGCPFVVKHYEKPDQQTMNMLAKEYKGEDVVWLAINSGAPGLQGHGMDLNKQVSRDWNINHPILIDETGNVGRAYDAKTTPHMFVIDADGTLVYDGAIDNNRSRNTFGDVNYVREALEALTNGREVETQTSSPYGCSVKYGA
jgi:peroxiredoxin